MRPPQIAGSGLGASSSYTELGPPDRMIRRRSNRLNRGGGRVWGEARRGAIPCRASALSSIRQEAHVDAVETRRWALLADAETTMIIPPRFAAYPRCEDTIWRGIQDAMEGRCSPREAVARAAAAIQPIVGVQAAVES